MEQGCSALHRDTHAVTMDQMHTQNATDKDTYKQILWLPGCFSPIERCDLIRISWMTQLPDWLLLNLHHEGHQMNAGREGDCERE